MKLKFNSFGRFLRNINSHPNFKAKYRQIKSIMVGKKVFFWKDSKTRFNCMKITFFVCKIRKIK